MYYEESVVDGVLHYKLSPESRWIPCSALLLTNRYISSQIVIKELTEQVEQLIRDGNKIDYMTYEELYPLPKSTKGGGHGIPY